MKRNELPNQMRWNKNRATTMLLLGISLLLLAYTINIGIRYAYMDKMNNEKEELLQQLVTDNEQIKDEMDGESTNGLDIYVHKNNQTDGSSVITFPKK